MSDTIVMPPPFPVDTSLVNHFARILDSHDATADKNRDWYIKCLSEERQLATVERAKAELARERYWEHFIAVQHEKGEWQKEQAVNIALKERRETEIGKLIVIGVCIAMVSFVTRIAFINFVYNL